MKFPFGAIQVLIYLKGVCRILTFKVYSPTVNSSNDPSESPISSAQSTLLARLSHWDHTISKRMHIDDRSSPLWKWAAFLAHSGDSWFWAAGLLILWFLIRPWRSVTAFLFIDVCLFALLVFGIKQIFKRRRPPGDWLPEIRNTDPHSFPSGHAARAFMLATLALMMGPPWLGLLALIWAILVCLSRIMTAMHYISDVVAG